MPNPTTPETLEYRLARLERQLAEQYCQAGKSLLEIAERENRRIGALVDEIVETRRRLADRRHDRPCNSCGGLNSADSRFCRHCGRQQDIPETREETSL